MRSWLKSKDDVRFSDPFSNSTNIHVTAVVDCNGPVYHEITEGKYDRWAYIAFLERMHAALGKPKNVALWFDGLAVHKT